jgi:hypothetical protein
MAELVNEVCDENKVRGAEPRSIKKGLFLPRKDPAALHLSGLLTSPKIEVLDPWLFPADDQVESIIQITVLADYGLASVYVTLEDERGGKIEGGFALQDETAEDDWYYFPSASLSAGASVTVRAIAMDPLGGVGIQIEKVRV